MVNIIKLWRNTDSLRKAYIKTMNLYAPRTLIVYYRNKYKNNRSKYHDLEKNLKKCRMPISVPRYLAAATFYPLIFLPGFLLLGFFIGGFIADIFTGNTFNLLPINLPFSFAFLEPYKAGIIKALFIIIFTFLFTFITRFLILIYPKIYAAQRKQQIEVVFPHVVNMMLGMAKGGTPIMKLFKVISEETSVTGEVGKEFAIIVMKVEMFHKDLIKSIREVAQTTPSEIFSDFLDDLVSILEGSGKISEFLEFKSKHLMDEKEKFQSVFLNSLGIMAEVYVTTLVVAPLFLIIIFVVMGMIGDVNQQLMTLIIYIYMPIGGLMFIIMLSSMMKGYEVKWTGEKIKKFPVMARVVKGKEYNNFRYQSALQQYLSKLIKKLRIIFSDIRIFMYKPEYTFYFTIPITVASIPFIIKWSVETILIYVLVLNFIPYALLTELRKRRVSKIEEHIPDFLKQLASLNESGLNLVVAIRMLSSSNLGVLTKEIIKIRKDLEWGMLLSDALKRFEVRVGSATVTQVTSILLRAMEATGTIKDALFTAARDAQLHMKLKKNVKNEMFVYVVVIYMTFFVFLVTILILSRNFLQVLPRGMMGIQEFSGTSFNIPDPAQLSSLFYHTTLINGMIGGLVAGLMGEGELKSGLKHAILLVFVAFIAFKIFG